MPLHWLQNFIGLGVLNLSQSVCASSSLVPGNTTKCTLDLLTSFDALSGQLTCPKDVKQTQKLSKEEKNNHFHRSSK
jgi:hypothetical protein